MRARAEGPEPDDEGPGTYRCFWLDTLGSFTNGLSGGHRREFRRRESMPEGDRECIESVLPAHLSIAGRASPDGFHGSGHQETGTDRNVRMSLCYSQSLRLNKKYNPTEPTTISSDEAMRPGVLAKPGYGRF